MYYIQTSLFYNLQELARNSSLLPKYYYLVLVQALNFPASPAEITASAEPAIHNMPTHVAKITDSIANPSHICYGLDSKSLILPKSLLNYLSLCFFANNTASCSPNNM